MEIRPCELSSLGLSSYSSFERDAAAVPETGLLQSVGDHVLRDVCRVAHAVDVADLVPVVGRDRYLCDTHSGIVELDDDLRVEVESVGVELVGDLLERLDRVRPISAVEFGELGPERCVLEAGEDPVPDVLVERHAAFASGSFDHDAGAEHCIGLTREQRGEDVGQRLGRVLAVAVEHHHEIEPVLDGDLVAGLLVAAVPQVLRLSDERDGQVGHLLVAETDQVGRVLAVVVADDDLFDVRPDLLGDPVEHPGKSRCRVVGDDQYPDPLLVVGSHLYPLECPPPCVIDPSPARATHRTTTDRQSSQQPAPTSVAPPTRRGEVAARSVTADAPGARDRPWPPPPGLTGSEVTGISHAIRHDRRDLRVTGEPRRVPCHPARARSAALP